MDHWQWNDAIRLLGDRAHQRQDRQAADHWEQYMLMNLRTSSSFNESEYYLRLPYMIRAHRAAAAAAEGDCATAVQQAELALAAMPGQTSVVEDLVPQLQQLECNDAAGALFDRVREHYRAALADFPESADLHNNLAWLSARCQRQLDEAFDHAQRAVDLRPHRPGYIDTLAEVHFHRGDRDEAVRLSEQSISLAPANATFQKQLERFRNDPLPE